MALDWYTRLFWTGQILSGGADSSQQIVMVSSGSQVLVALATGLLMAFAFQLLLANFGVAVGMTALSILPRLGSNDSDDTQVEAKSHSLSQTISRVSLVAGSGVLLTIDAVLFAACFLAVKLSLVNDLTSGAIIGIIIWSTYCLLLTWISSSAASFLTNTVLSTATSGLRNLLKTVSAAFSNDSTPPMPVEATDPQELRAALDSLDLESILKDYLNTFQLPKPELGSVQQKLGQLLNDSTLKSLANSPLQTLISRQTFTDWVNRTTDFSGHEAEQVVDQLDTIWHQLRTQAPDDQASELLDSLQAGDFKAFANAPNGDLNQVPTEPDSESKSALPALFQQVDIKTLMQTALNRVDLSDWDIERVWHQLQPLKQWVGGPDAEGQEPTEFFNIIRVDMETYLLNTHPWHLNSDALKSEFKQILYDPEAAPTQIQPLLEQLDRDQFAHILKQRNDLASDQINQIVDQLEAVRQEVLTIVEPPQADPAEIQAATTELWQRLESYLRYTSLSKLNGANIKHKLQTLVAESQLSPSQLGTELASFDPNALVQVLKRRQGLKLKAREQLIDQVQAAWADLLEASSTSETEETNDNLLRVVADYLQEIDWSTLSLEDIKQDVIKLLDDPQQGTLALKRRMTHLDWSALGDRLTQRQDLDPAQIKQALGQVGEAIRQITKTPRRWATRAQKATKDLQAEVNDYLLHREKAELNPDAIQRDLQRILDQSGTGAVKQIWQTKTNGNSQETIPPIFERPQLKEILQQRQDITAAEVSQIVDQIESTWNQLLEQARQTQDQLQTTLDQVLSIIRDALGALNLPELRAETIQQELSKLFNSSQLGLERLKDVFSSLLQATSSETLDDSPLNAFRERLSQLSHDSIKRLLNAREDLSEDISNQIVEQIEQVRDQMLEQAETLQQAVQTRVEEFKQQAQQKVAAVHSAAMIAAWWLFGIAFSSLCTSAAAGALAVITNQSGWGVSI